MSIFHAKANYVSTLALGLIVLYCYLMSTHFVDIHSNGAEGLVTCYLTEQNCEGEEMEVCPRNLRNEVFNFEQTYNLAPVDNEYNTD
jgi:molybdopterin/thiamine biosynthesis adenylyltransferase